MELHEEITRIKSIMGLKSEIINENPIKRITPSSGWCTSEQTQVYDNLVNTVYPPLVSQAIKWWSDWLSSPITKEKFIKNHINTGIFTDPKNPNPQTDEIFKGYFDILNQIKLVPYGSCKDGEHNSPYYAYVTENTKNNVYVNTEFTDLDKQSLLEIFIHEVQHILYFYQPLNPSEKIDNCFTKKTFIKGRVFQKIKNIFRSIFNKNTPSAISDKSINNIVSSFNIPVESAKKVYEWFIGEIDTQKKKGMESYILDTNELQSRITGIRQRLGIAPGENITAENFKPFITDLINSSTPDEYFNKLNKDSINFYWLLLFWGYKGFNDLNSVLPQMNSLAYQKNKSGTDNVA